MLYTMQHHPIHSNNIFNTAYEPHGGDRLALLKTIEEYHRLCDNLVSPPQTPTRLSEINKEHYRHS